MRVQRLALLLIVCTAGPLHADPGTPGSVPALTGQEGSASRPGVRDELALAVQHYQRGEFEEARQLLDRLLGQIGQERSRAAQQAHLYRAFVHSAFDENELALASFERALAIDPSLTLESAAPKLEAAFQQARRRYRAKMEALDHDPPQIEHRPPQQAASYNTAIALSVRALDPSGVKKVLLNYRVRGGRGFSSITMEPDPQGRHLATIPSLAVVQPGVEYFVEAYDRLGNGPGLKGSAAKPILIAVKGGPPRAAVPEGPRAWYQKWWVWAIAAGAVGVAAAVGASVYVTRDQTVSYDVRWSEGLAPKGGK